MTGAALILSFAQAAPKTNGSTPLERRSLLLWAPPASIERHARSERSVEDFVHTIEGYRDSPPVTQPAPIKIPPCHFIQLSAVLRSKPSLHQIMTRYRKLSLSACLPRSTTSFLPVTDEINEKLKRIAARDDAAGKFADDIRKGGSSRIILPEDEAKSVSQRHPDGQFQHQRAAYPGVVLDGVIQYDIWKTRTRVSS
ncbi:hypothetical protein PG991_009163 [Apiospora marii]|uniref:Uncharacterized protein n=1 Tax=Apiospora marii TaxID=335849 RepID=A0ABR1RJV2_9PEZI